ncbi:MAG: hypothetical protein LBO20_08755 [Bifidobacteriaceae bacterium]|jgi:hypothetical protein|nr:hypothetical protein [Bifidobacteriaceae bacterium]
MTQPFDPGSQPQWPAQEPRPSYGGGFAPGPAPGGAPLGDVFSQPAFAKRNPAPPPPRPAARVKRRSGGRGLLALLLVAAVAVGGFMVWRAPRENLDKFCAIGAEKVGQKVTLEELENQYKTMWRVAPKSIRDDIKNQLEFIKNEPELNQILLNGDPTSMSDAEKADFTAKFKVARDKYDITNSAERITKKIEEVCGGGRPKCSPHRPRPGLTE